MNVRAIVLTLACLVGPSGGWAQQPAKVARLGMLCGVTCQNPGIEEFQKALRELGWVEGQSIVIERRWAQNQFDRLPALAAELVALRVDVIFVPGGTPVARAAKGATSTIPIVIGGVADPVRSGLVASLARPGGNLTGLSLQTPELARKRLDLLKQAVPGASRVGYLTVPGTQPTSVAESLEKEREATARSLAMSLQPVPVSAPFAPGDLENAFSAMTSNRVDALLVQNAGPLTVQLTRIAALALKHRLPAIAEGRDFAAAGGLLAYGPSFSERHRRAAGYVDKILKGAKPADLPIEQPSTFWFAVNLKTAKALGLSIPPVVIERADEIIQ